MCLTLRSTNLYLSKPLRGQPMSLKDKIRYIYFVAVCLSLESPNLYLSKPLCMHAQPMSLNDKFGYGYFVAACRTLGCPKSYLSKSLWLRAQPMGHNDKICCIYFVAAVWHWGVLTCICQNHCACVSSLWTLMTKLGIYILWPHAWH